MLSYFFDHDLNGEYNIAALRLEMNKNDEADYWDEGVEEAVETIFSAVDQNKDFSGSEERVPGISPYINAIAELEQKGIIELANEWFSDSLRGRLDSDNPNEVIRDEFPNFDSIEAVPDVFEESFTELEDFYNQLVDVLPAARSSRTDEDVSSKLYPEMEFGDKIYPVAGMAISALEHYIRHEDERKGRLGEEISADIADTVDLEFLLSPYQHSEAEISFQKEKPEEKDPVGGGLQTYAAFQTLANNLPTQSEVEEGDDYVEEVDIYLEGESNAIYICDDGPGLEDEFDNLSKQFEMQEDWNEDDGSFGIPMAYTIINDSGGTLEYIDAENAEAYSREGSRKVELPECISDRDETGAVYKVTLPKAG